MLLFTISIAVIIGVLLSRKYSPKSKSAKIWASVLIPLISGIIINIVAAACKNSRFGFATDLGSTFLFVAIPEIALLITLLVSLKVGEKKDRNDTSTTKLHYGTGENRVDFEVNLTQKEILQMAKLREQDPKKWKDNELELVKAIRKGINNGKPNENASNIQNPESLKVNPIETEIPTEKTTAQNEPMTKEKLDNETRTEERKERKISQEMNPETHHKFKMKRSVRILLGVIACIVLFFLFSALTTMLGLKRGGGAIVMVAFMGLMAFVWRSIVGKKTDDGLHKKDNESPIQEDNIDNESEINIERSKNETVQEKSAGKRLLANDAESISDLDGEAKNLSENESAENESRPQDIDNENEIKIEKSKNETVQEKSAGKGLLANDTESISDLDGEAKNLSENESVKNEPKLQEPFIVEKSGENMNGFVQTKVNTIKGQGNKSLKCLKKILITILSLGIVFGFGILTSFVYIKYVYPSKAKSEDEKLIQEAKDNPTKAYEIAQEMFKRHEKGHNSEFESLFSRKRGVCSYNHEQAGKKAANIYCQYMKEYAKKDLSMSDNIAIDLFKRYDNHCNKLYNETGIEILKYAAEQGDASAQFSLGCYYNGLNYTKDHSWWSNTTIDGNKTDPTKAAYWYMQSANQGNTSAMGNLGNAYMSGDGVARNEEKGLELIKKAASLENAFYQCRLGDYYRDGVNMKAGSHKEIQKAVYGKAYRSEDKIREYWDDSKMEWVKYYQVEVVDYKTILPKDIKLAQYWWKKAADNGDETAKERLQQIYE